MSSFVAMLMSVIAIVSIVVSFKEELRWSGRLAALSALLGLVFRIPTPWVFLVVFLFWLAGGLIDLVRMSQSRSQWVSRVVGVSIGIGFLFISSLEKTRISLNGDELQSLTYTGQEISVKARDLALFRLTGWDGTLAEWRFVSKTKGLKDPFVANVLEDKLYLSSQGTVLSGTQVVEEIAAWAAIKPIQRSYEAYEYNGDHSTEPASGTSAK